MSDTTMLVFLCLIMLVGSYLAGILPLIVTLSEERLQLISIFGAGLLVGVALAVIIPEGIQMLYNQQLEDLKHALSKHGDGTHTPHQAGVNNQGGGEFHAIIGVALVLGFVFMLLIDQIGSSHSRDPESGSSRSSRSFTATLGLIVHAAADGIALGAAASTSHTDIELIVFIAIMLHKAPASFGLVTYLLHDGLERSRIRRYLLIFSLAAPGLAIITFFGLSQKSKETLSNANATAFAMLFSAGTFLYVATIHVLSDLVRRSSGHSHSMTPSTDSGTDKGFTRCELLALVSGALLPLTLTTFHHH